MFNAEPIGLWTPEERDDFEQYVAERHRQTIRSAAWAGLILLIVCLCIVPFSTGHPLNRHWNVARYLVYLAELAFLWFGMKVGFIYSSWQSARETRREME